MVGPLDVPNNPQAFGCFLYNAIYANFPAELFNAVSSVEQVINFISSKISPGYKALGCAVNFPDAKGSKATQQWNDYVTKYVGPAKTKAVGSGWYQK